jgi:hypothetical protein
MRYGQALRPAQRLKIRICGTPLLISPKDGDRFREIRSQLSFEPVRIVPEPCPKWYVKHDSQIRPASGFSLLELLFVISIIIVLASLFLGPASRVLGRVLADQWYDQASNLLRETVNELNQRFQGLDSFPLVTLERIEAQGLLKPRELRFLKDPRVTFVPFTGSDPGDKIVIQVQLKRGFWTEGSELIERKEAITHVPK